LQVNEINTKLQSAGYRGGKEEAPQAYMKIRWGSWRRCQQR